MSAGLASITLSSSSSSNFNTDGVETDSSFFRRKQPIEDLVAKFLKDSIKPQKTSAPITSSDSSSSINKSLEGSPTKRLGTPRKGIDGKSYRELDHPEVSARLWIDEGGCDVLRTTSDIGMNIYLIYTKLVINKL